ncbi:uncharacterized protein LOC141665237 [Apium graveolens]|uniref:uncharacterized protein LOC141665237 n=1 Tax=Apium graveolens TaxID=4045 RepID=UPI003D7A0DFE
MSGLSTYTQTLKEDMDDHHHLSALDVTQVAWTLKNTHMLAILPLAIWNQFVRKRRVTVHIPEPEQIGVKRPASHDNNDSIRTPRANDGSSASGKRNLFEAFNDAAEIQIDTCRTMSNIFLMIMQMTQTLKIYGWDTWTSGLHLSLKPKDGQPAKFCQLYVYDTENEIENRMNAVPSSEVLDPDIVEGLLKMLDENNQLAEGFRYARDRINLGKTDDFSLLLVSSKSASGRKNQVGPSNEVATLLQYPLLFPYGDYGFHLDIPLHNKKPKVPDENVSDLHPDETQHRTTIIMREYYAYKLMICPEEGMNLHLGGRLWQQFVVDAFSAVEQYRLDWIRAHQNIIRSDLYKSIRDSVSKGDTNPSTKGKNVILPVIHTGSQRCMNQYFKDSLAICHTIGHPSLFLTMTCNTQWPEIKSMMKFFPVIDVADKPDVTARVFKLKLDQLLDLIKNKNYFGKCIGGIIHVIEFQKRGLPHCHMLIWLHPRDRPQNVDDINQLISAEIPDKYHDPIGFNVVNSHMIHRPCGKDYSYSPCMVKGNCGRYFPKRFNAHTFFDDCGFPVYRRQRTGLTVTKKGVDLDNQYVVPYNRDLLVRFHCHINLEQGNEASTSSSKPKSNDEIKKFLDGRYICASEAAWRLLGFDIHHRFPTVEHFPVHLEGEKSVSFKQHENLQDVAEKDKKRFSKLEGWFQANKNIPEARQFTYH